MEWDGVGWGGTYLDQFLTWVMVPLEVGKLFEKSIPPSGFPA